MEKITNLLTISLKILDHGQGLDLPTYATSLSAGMDLRAAIGAEDIILAPMARVLVPCGFAMALPQGFEAQIRSRSGLAFNNGVIVLNAPGTIDADYRGEIKVLLMNLGSEVFTVTHGMRVAQMLIAPVTQCEWSIVSDFEEITERSAGGFGSTGVG
ncbi:MAG: dUTP diphosphatase [Alphaproteobacteria bacterium]